MTQQPVEPSKFHLVIRELGRMTTKGGVASLTIGLLFLFGVFALFLMTGYERVGVIVLVLLLMVGYSVYTFSQLNWHDEDKKESDAEVGSAEGG